MGLFFMCGWGSIDKKIALIALLFNFNLHV